MPYIYTHKQRPTDYMSIARRSLFLLTRTHKCMQPVYIATLRIHCLECVCWLYVCVVTICPAQPLESGNWTIITLRGVITQTHKTQHHIQPTCTKSFEVRMIQHSRGQSSSSACCVFWPEIYSVCSRIYILDGSRGLLKRINSTSNKASQRRCDGNGIVARVSNRRDAAERASSSNI